MIPLFLGCFLGTGLFSLAKLYHGFGLFGQHFSTQRSLIQWQGSLIRVLGADVAVVGETVAMVGATVAGVRQLSVSASILVVFWCRQLLCFLMTFEKAPSPIAVPPGTGQLLMGTLGQWQTVASISNLIETTQKRGMGNGNLLNAHLIGRVNKAHPAGVP